MAAPEATRVQRSPFMGFVWMHSLGIEIFEKRLILFKFKKEDNLVLTLHCVQPQEYIEYFED